MFKSEMFTVAEEDLPLYREAGVQVINRPQLDTDHLAIIQVSTSTANQKIAEMVLSFCIMTISTTFHWICH